MTHQISNHFFSLIVFHFSIHSDEFNLRHGLEKEIKSQDTRWDVILCIKYIENVYDRGGEELKKGEIQYMNPWCIRICLRTVILYHCTMFSDLEDCAISFCKLTFFSLQMLYCVSFFNPFRWIQSSSELNFILYWTLHHFRLSLDMTIQQNWTSQYISNICIDFSQWNDTCYFIWVWDE